MTYELLTQITTLTSDIDTHFGRAWQASMTQDNGQPDELEKQYQINLAIVELQKLNQLVFPASAEITELILEQRAEIDGLRSIFDLNENGKD